MKRTLILGGPGSGKTHRLLGVMEAAIKRGLPPNRIAFVSFTNAAADEAKDRACKKFGFIPSDLPNFRTLHSLAYRELMLKRNEVITETHLKEFGELIGELFTGETHPDAPAQGRNADPLLTLLHYARATQQSLRKAWEDHGGMIEWYRFLRFADAYTAYKLDLDLLDFTDMLERYINVNLPPVDVDIAIVDEAQDLSKLQFKVAEKAFAKAKEVWWAGDDDQAVHHWAGAASEHLFTLDAAHEVLPTSHRLPKTIFDLSQTVARRITKRFAKETGSQKPGGLVNWVASPDETALSSGSWLLLARTRAQLAPLAALARDQGVIYRVKKASSVDPAHTRAIQAHEALRAGRRVEGTDAQAALKAAGRPFQGDEAATYTASELGYDARPIWHDALIRIPLDDREYYLSCMRRGERLTAEPRIRIETIHGAKGAEAEKVLLVTDMNYRVNQGMEYDSDAEHRVLYVGLTRASEELHLVAPQSAYGYQI